MKVITWIGGILAALAVLAGLAWLNRPLIVGMIIRASLPHIAPNMPVSWQAGPATPVSGDRPPNILVILADDMGFNDITFNGGGIAHGGVPTPNIDSIGREGVSFANGYDGNATCAPSRATIMTGRYATRFGFEFTPAPVAFERMLGTEGEKGSLVKPTFFADQVKNTPKLDELRVPPRERFIAQVLKDQGYHTIHLGKWHLGGTKGSRPEDKGFDESLGFMAGGSMYLPENDPGVVNAKQPWDPIDRYLWLGLPYMVQYNGSTMFQPAGYMTDYLTDEAIKAINANANRPFFMYYAPNAIHTPLQATKADYDALPQIKDHRLRVYGAMMRNFDRNVGRLLQTLKDRGLDKNTLVIFTSDNGGAGYIGLPDINKPYRGWKATFFEGGIHSPFFMRWPAKIAAGQRFDRPVGHIDIFATAAAAAGAKVPSDRVIDGVDLLPYVTGQQKGRPHQTMFWRSGAYKVVLDGDWKLQSSEAQHKVWLYNLATDPTEQHELSKAEPARLQAMLDLLKKQDAQSVKSMWPSLLRGAVYVDHPGGVQAKPGDEYVLWDN